MKPHTPLPPTVALASILIDIEKSIAARLYYPALLIALTLPEVCSALALDRSIFVKEKHYVDFVDKYATPEGLGCTGVDCYRMRGGLVHRGSLARHPKFDATHVIFTLPEAANPMHGFSIQNPEAAAACFDLVSFCNAMIRGASTWYREHKDNPIVQKNMPHVIRYCPEGKSPFLFGIPVVASGL